MPAGAARATLTALASVKAHVWQRENFHRIGHQYQAACVATGAAASATTALATRVTVGIFAFVTNAALQATAIDNTTFASDFAIDLQKEHARVHIQRLATIATSSARGTAYIVVATPRAALAAHGLRSIGAVCPLAVVSLVTTAAPAPAAIVQSTFSALPAFTTVAGLLIFASSPFCANRRVVVLKVQTSAIFGGVIEHLRVNWVAPETLQRQLTQNDQVTFDVNFCPRLGRADDAEFAATGNDDVLQRERRASRKTYLLPRVDLYRRVEVLAALTRHGCKQLVFVLCHQGHWASPLIYWIELIFLFYCHQLIKFEPRIQQATHVCFGQHIARVLHHMHIQSHERPKFRHIVWVGLPIL